MTDDLLDRLGIDPIGQGGSGAVPEIVEHSVLDLLFRPYRRVLVQCVVKYHTGPFTGEGTVWNLSASLLAGVSQETSRCDRAKPSR